MGFDLEAFREEHRRQQAAPGGGFLDNFVKMPDGDGIVTVRILEGAKGRRFPFVVTRTHKLGQKNFHSLLNLVGQKWVGVCPLNNFYKSLWKQVDDAKTADEKEKWSTQARAVKPQERYYYNVIVRSVTMPDGNVQKNIGPKILSVGKKLHAKIIRAIVGDEAMDEPGLGDITDPKTGRDLKIIKKVVKGFGTESFPNYDESRFLNPSVLGSEKQVEEWLANLHDLESLRILKPAEELSKEIRIFRGLEKDESTEFDLTTTAATRTAPSRTPPPAKGAVAADDEDLALVEEDYLSEITNKF